MSVLPLLAVVSPAALTLLLPLAPSLSVIDPDNVLSVTVTVLLPAARLIVANLLTPPRLTLPALVSVSVFVPLPPVSVSPPTAAAETSHRVVLEPAGEAVRPRPGCIGQRLAVAGRRVARRADGVVAASRRR